jgi:hypothetical protein
MFSQTGSIRGIRKEELKDEEGEVVPAVVVLPPASGVNPHTALQGAGGVRVGQPKGGKVRSEPGMVERGIGKRVMRLCYNVSTMKTNG